jgi:hypothetical protein
MANCAGAYTELAKQLPPKVLFGAFLGMFIASHSKSIPFADLIIDHESFESDSLYRREIEGNIYKLTGLSLDLSNYQSNRTNVAPAMSPWELAEISDIVFSILESDYTPSVNLSRKLLDSHICLTSV